jgi:hypothetical protein
MVTRLDAVSDLIPRTREDLICDKAGETFSPPCSPDNLVLFTPRPANRQQSYVSCPSPPDTSGGRLNLYPGGRMGWAMFSNYLVGELNRVTALVKHSIRRERPICRSGFMME